MTDGSHGTTTVIGREHRWTEWHAEMLAWGWASQSGAMAEGDIKWQLSMQGRGKVAQLVKVYATTRSPTISCYRSLMEWALMDRMLDRVMASNWVSSIDPNRLDCLSQHNHQKRQIS